MAKAAQTKSTTSDDSTNVRKGTYEFIDHTIDVCVVGAGGAGLRATLGAPPRLDLKTACITKVFPDAFTYRCCPGRRCRLTW